MPDEAEKETPPVNEPHVRSEIDLLTLTITAVASAVAAYIASHVWKAGTLPFAASMPVIVALVKEGLRRPTDAVANGTRLRTTRRLPVTHHWKVAAITGVAGFALFAFIATASELLAGRSIGPGNRATTLFGGTRTVVKQNTVTVKTVTQQVTTVVKEAPTKTTTTTQTVTPPPVTQTVPVTPTQTTPAPTPDGSQDPQATPAP